MFRMLSVNFRAVNKYTVKCRVGYHKSQETDE